MGCRQSWNHITQGAYGRGQSQNERTEGEKALRILSCPSLPSSMKNPTRQWASKSGDPWKSGSPFQRTRHGFGGRALVGPRAKPAGTAWNLHCPSTNPPLEPRDWPLKAPSSGLDAHQWAVPEAITRLDDCNFHAWPPRLISDVSIYITGARCLVRRYFVQSLISSSPATTAVHSSFRGSTTGDFSARLHPACMQARVSS